MTTKSLPIERFRRVASVWNWLPTFRAVAEHESIHRASSVLATSPSALSRTIRLLEDALGTTLFHRRDSKMALTPPGDALLSAIRDAMRLVDDGLPPEHEPTEEQVVSLRLATIPDGISPLVDVIAARRVVREVADVSAVTRGVGAAPDWPATHDLLLRGDLDVVITLLPGSVAPPELVVERCGALQMGVYVGPSHALAAGREPAEDSDAIDREMPTLPFVVHANGDGWPVERPRATGVVGASFQAVLAHCMNGEMAACLADVIVRDLGLGGVLVRVADAGAPRAVFTVRRRPLARDARNSRAVDVVLAALRGLLSS